MAAVASKMAVMERRLIAEDEALRGEWKGFRSSRLGRQFRAIYKVERDQVLVQVVNINAHDYRKK